MKESENVGPKHDSRAGGRNHGNKVPTKILRGVLSPASIAKYRENFLQKFGKIRILGMSRPVDVEQIFTFVRVSDSSRLAQYRDARELNSEFLARQRKFAQGDKSIDLIDAASGIQFLQLIGAPGSGKSTAMKQLAGIALKSLQSLTHVDRNPAQFPHRVLPILIELSRISFSIGGKHTSPRECLEKSIAAELRECGLSQSEMEGLLAACKSPEVDEKQADGNEIAILFLLDGLDEVAPEWSSAANNGIADLADVYRLGRFVVSCRIGTRQMAVQKFQDALLDEFSDEQILQFIGKWHDTQVGNSSKASKLLGERLLADSAGTLKELARTPLFLALLCIVSGHDARVPRNRIELYRRALEILLIEWNKTKPLLHGSRLKIAPHKELLLLEKIAYNLFVGNQCIFSITVLESFIQRNLHMLDHWFRRNQLGPSDMIRIVESEQGLWIRRSADYYSFSHLTLQEFLTARYIYNAGSVEEIVIPNLYDDRWREVIIMLSCHPRGERLIDVLARNVHAKASRVVSLQPVVNWLRVFVPSGKVSSQFLALGLIFCCMDAIRSGPRERGKRIIESRDASRMSRRLRLEIERAGGDIERLLPPINLASDAASSEEVMNAARRAVHLAYYIDSAADSTNSEVSKKSRELASSGANLQQLTSLILAQMKLSQHEFAFKDSVESAVSRGAWDAQFEPDPANIQNITGFDCRTHYLKAGEGEILVECMYGASLVEICSISAENRNPRWCSLLTRKEY